MSIDLKYTKKVIAFLDIMGFKSIINKTTNNSSFCELLISNLIELKGMENKKSLMGTGRIEEGKNVTVFSDSIVISYDLSLHNAIDKIIFDIIIMQIDLIAMGLLLRGGVTIGDVFHEGGVVLGPAMNRAYEIESKLSIYPRIMVDPILVKYACENTDSNDIGRRAENNILRFLAPCENSYYFTDFLSMDTELGYEYGRFLRDVKKLIDDGVNSENLSVRSKYLWLKNYYDETIKDVRVPLL